MSLLISRQGNDETEQSLTMLWFFSFAFVISMVQASLFRFNDKDLKQKNGSISFNFQTLFEWFFEQTTHIEITEILGSSEFSNTIIQDLMRSRTDWKLSVLNYNSYFLINPLSI